MENIHSTEYASDNTLRIFERERERLKQKPAMVNSFIA